jgi:hypothetical protein
MAREIGSNAMSVDQIRAKKNELPLPKKIPHPPA